MGKIVGYARVSSTGQSLEIQMDKLKAIGCDRVFKEKLSGKQADNRPELQRCLEYVREGDTLVVTKLDRMARSTFDLLRIVEGLDANDVAFKALDQTFDTTTSEGRLMMRLLAAVAEFENDIRAERQADGIAKAQAKGVKFGRKPALTDKQIAEIRRLRNDEGVSIGRLQDKFGVGRTTVYRALGGRT